MKTIELNDATYENAVRLAKAEGFDDVNDFFAVQIEQACQAAIPPICYPSEAIVA